ncbi:N-acetylglucosamine-6-phosphate deacetylase [Jatrophihabitans sp.]|uniref:N-acetylglucosamine-6-phosphate deacetylase n=1 Tax=Jatrophihabitans sp. TaxID=1932789 RepID=UPI002C2C2BC6|nr:N-acetylglucosamine-6-phosphate deacetylase [Jatrophihabitans sp.]
MTVLTGAQVVSPTGVLADGEVRIAGGRIVAVGTGSAPAQEERIDLAGCWLVPGFVDLHMHGGGGHDVTRSAADLTAAVRFHRSHGTTRTLVSLMAQPVDQLCEQLGWIAELTAAGEVLGAHLEGPFLSAARCGAQRPENLLAPDPLVLGKLLEAGQGSVRTMTVAPELPGAAGLIADLLAAGVIAAVGHSDASYEQAAEAFAAGATLATHLFNAMGSSLDHRAPGPSVAALDASVFVEMINDGVHVHDALTRLVARVAPERLIFITDAISAAGIGDGEYTLADQTVRVSAGNAWSEADRLAGSTLTMDEAVRRAVHQVGLGIEQAVAAAATTPARLLGLADECGAIRAGLAADLVVLDADLRVRRVMVGGDWLDG